VVPDSQTNTGDDVRHLPNDRKLVVIQRNPTSGSGRLSKQLQILIRDLRKAGFRVRLFANRDRFDSFVRTPEVHAAIRCLVAAGGDGTIASLANRHAEIPIATLPMGTENLVARHLNVPKCGSTVATLIQEGSVRTFDTAMINDQRFLLMASVGLDADVVDRLHAARTGNIGRHSYAKPILQSFLGFPFPKFSVHSLDGELLAEGSHVIATNIPEYGFRMPFCPDADCHDGQLDVRVFRQSGRFATLMHALRTRFGFADRTSEVARFQTAAVEIRSDSPNSTAQCDGDPAGHCPVQIHIDPHSMSLVVRRD